MGLQAFNPVAPVFDHYFDRQVRTRFFKGIDYAEPLGDPGWFGPESKVWYVHSNFPTMFFGLFCAAVLEGLDPHTAMANYDHSRAMERDEKGVPTGRTRSDGVLARFTHSLTFFTATAYGSTQAAERSARIVRAMHRTVNGESAFDGSHYDAEDPDFLQWNYATVVWGIGTAHENLHRRPLKGADLDQYYREFSRVGEALGGVNLPKSKGEVLEVLDDWAPRLALIPFAAETLTGDLFPGGSVVINCAKDLLPDYAQRLYSYEPGSIVTQKVRRTFMRAALNGGHAAIGGPLREFKQAQARVTGVPLRDIRFEPNIERGKVRSRAEVELDGGDPDFNPARMSGAPIASNS